MRFPIHIYTSGKGGVGKTLQALCSSLHYLDRALPVMVCDFNNFNADLRQLLKGLVDKEFINQGGLVFRPLRSIPDSYVVSLANLYDLHEDGIGGFFKHLNTVFDFCKTKGLRPEAVVADTGYHLANFDKYDVLRQIKLNDMAKDYTPYLWFVWTLAAVLRDEEMSALINTVDTLKTVDLGWKKPFSDSNNIIHVINPHAFMQPVSLAKFFRNLLRTENDLIRVVESLDKVYHLETGQGAGLSLNYIRTRMRASLIGDDIDRRTGGQNVRKEFFDNLVLPILTNNKRNQNLFVIPFFDENLAAYTDSFAMKPDQGVENLKQGVQSIFQVISHYLESMA